jgi:hypothetical protein
LIEKLNIGILKIPLERKNKKAPSFSRKGFCYYLIDAETSSA